MDSAGRDLCRFFHFHLSDGTRHLIGRLLDFRHAADCGLGWSFHRDETLRVDREHGLLRFEGEWKTLIQITIFFVYRYYWGYKTATAPELVTIPGVALNYVGFNGILTGLFIGWRLHTFYVYRMGPTEDLTIADVVASPTDA